MVPHRVTERERERETMSELHTAQHAVVYVRRKGHGAE